MSSTEMEHLAQDYANDSALRDRIERALNLEDAHIVAKAAGYDVTVDEARSYMTTLQSASQAELSDTQLDAVAGGKAATPIGTRDPILGQPIGSHPGHSIAPPNIVPLMKTVG